MSGSPRFASVATAPGRLPRGSAGRFSTGVAVSLVLLGSASPSLGRDDPFAFVQVSTPEQRLEYLAHARVWSDPGDSLARRCPSAAAT